MNDMRKLIDAVQLNESVNTRVDESHGVPIDLLAKIGLYLDDPYGDGIRLDDIREPDEGRLAALQQVAGQPILDGETLIRDKYEEKVRWAVKSKAGRNDLVRQGVLTKDELGQLHETENIVSKIAEDKVDNSARLLEIKEEMKDLAERLSARLAESKEDRIAIIQLEEEIRALSVVIEKHDDDEDPDDKDWSDDGSNPVSQSQDGKGIVTPEEHS